MATLSGAGGGVGYGIQLSKSKIYGTLDSSLSINIEADISMEQVSLDLKPRPVPGPVLTLHGPDLHSDLHHLHSRGDHLCVENQDTFLFSWNFDLSGAPGG